MNLQMDRIKITDVAPEGSPSERWESSEEKAQLGAGQVDDQIKGPGNSEQKGPMRFEGATLA